ncbi:type 1 fimbrial protein, partial [Escherichia coli]|nr:type 1 fimbrial protein [Escherichia coli]
MLQRHQLYGAAIFLLLSGPIYAQTELIGGDIRFHGTVEALPCSVKPGGDKIGVNFKQISTKDLYSNKTSPPVPFTIPLENCSDAVFKTVSVTFSGIE